MGLIATAFWGVGDSPHSDEPRDGFGGWERRPASPATRGPAVARPYAKPYGGTARRPASLRGTDVDGGFLIDAEGRFVPSRDALDLFDYFFVASGEESEDAIVARIREEIQRRLGPNATPGALAFLEAYLRYRERTRDLAGRAAPEDALDAVVEIRRDEFGADADRLFGADEARIRMSLAQREIAGDPSLDEDEKRALMEALYAELPPEAQRARRRSMAPARLRADEADLRRAGATDAEVRAHRAELFGEEAADRLAALDQRRAEWDERVAAYLREREEVLADASRPRADREAEAETLLLERFAGPERLRVRALQDRNPPR